MRISSDVLVEPVGQDFLVYRQRSGGVLRLSGPAAECLRNVRAGLELDPNQEGLQILTEQGILEDSDSVDGTVSRRRLLALGAGVSISGLAVLAMPSVAFGASTLAAPVVSNSSLGRPAPTGTSTSGGFVVALSLQTEKFDYDPSLGYQVSLVTGTWFDVVPDSSTPIRLVADSATPNFPVNFALPGSLLFSGFLRATRGALVSEGVAITFDYD